jgi:hypothetical protein
MSVESDSLQLKLWSRIQLMRVKASQALETSVPAVSYGAAQKLADIVCCLSDTGLALKVQE